MSNDQPQKFRVKGEREFAFVTKSYSVRKTPKQAVEKTAINEYTVMLHGKEFSGAIVGKKQNIYTVELNGNIYRFQIDQDESLKRRSRGHKPEDCVQILHLKAPMPGKICEILVTKGSVVQKGETLLVLEAMKMQNRLIAEDEYLVTAVRVRPDESVMGDQILVDLEKI